MKTSLLILSSIQGNMCVEKRYSDPGTCAGNDASCAKSIDDDALALLQVQLRMQERHGHGTMFSRWYVDLRCIGNDKIYPKPALLSGECELWRQAVLEVGMNEEDISEFGRRVVKFPKSFVEYIMNRSNTLHTHKTKYSFLGRRTGMEHALGRSQTEVHARQWAIDFAMTNFTSSDIFVITGNQSEISEWKSLGDYDKTKELGDQTLHQHEMGVDVTYWNTMMSSDFTLCPGGDSPWSRRAYEAALARSICVIKSHEDDWLISKETHFNHTALQKVLDLFKYVLVDVPHSYSKSVADDNLGIFIKYLTFIEGDNVPP